MWSVACILGEMMCQRPLLPGNSTMNQLEKILEMTGVPTQEEQCAMNSPFTDIMLQSISLFERVTLNDLCPNASPDALNFMKQCMHFNPSKRCSAELALKHSFVSKFHDPRTEPNYPRGVIKVSLLERMATVDI